MGLEGLVLLGHLGARSPVSFVGWCWRRLFVVVFLLRSRRASGLGHDGLRTTKLTLDLLAGPSRRLNSPRLELAVGLGLLDHSSEPILSEDIHQLAVRIGVSEVTATMLV